MPRYIIQTGRSPQHVDEECLWFADDEAAIADGLRRLTDLTALDPSSTEWKQQESVIVRRRMGEPIFVVSVSVVGHRL